MKGQNQFSPPTTVVETPPQPWSPSTALAVCIGLFNIPVALAYLMRLAWIVPYLLFVSISLVLSFRTGAEVFYASMILNKIIGLGLVFVLARRATSVSIRPKYTRPYVVVLATICLFAISMIQRQLGVESVRLPSSSMMPGLPPGSVALVWRAGRFSATDRQVVRGEVYTYYQHEGVSTQYLARAIALGGERVEYRNRRLEINGSPTSRTTIATAEDGRIEIVDESYNEISWPIAIGTMPAQTRQDGDWELGNGQVFFLGDNRDAAMDSRYIGPIPVSQVIGRVIAVSPSLAKPTWL